MVIYFFLYAVIISSNRSTGSSSSAVASKSNFSILIQFFPVSIFARCRKDIQSSEENNSWLLVSIKFERVL